MINYSQNKTDCIVCPFNCKVCSYHNIPTNYLDIYNSQCYECKTDIRRTINNITYVVKYDAIQ